MKNKAEMGGLEFVHFVYVQTVGKHSSDLVSRSRNSSGDACHLFHTGTMHCS